MKRIAALLALAALPGEALAQAQARVCLPPSQAAALVTFALPTLVERLAERCRESLPPGAYLSVNAGVLADRYRPEAAAAWPEARRAIARIFVEFLGQPMPEDMDSGLVRTLAEPALAGLLASRVSRADCTTADAAMADVATLSGRAIGRLAAVAATIADRKGTGIAGILSVCQPGHSTR